MAAVGDEALVGRQHDLQHGAVDHVGRIERPDARLDEAEHNERPLYLKVQHVTQEQGTIDVVVDAEPFEVGVDPYNKLIDRNPDDNRKRVE